MKMHRDNRGITLLEVVLSVAILMLLMLGIGAMLTTSIRADTYTQDRHIADRLAHGLMERIIDFNAQGTANFAALVTNNFQGNMPNQPMIPGVRPVIPNEGATDRLYDDFNGDGVTDRGLGGKNIYVYQLLIDDILVGGQTGFLKRITIRVYFSDQNSAVAAVDPVRHPDPGGALPRRFGSPLTEITTYVALP